ncbi:MAG TPA: succinylglutamate desuccinylase/aspartoacylase family protein [Candidatus Eisenbacteria bacterium]|nr:succinylglutamate desuccinylase/aspartoacylase family protein [Candidatus Eisenbacteria bacterium]
MEHVANKIWKIDAGRPGPHLMVLGGVHGNELTGIEVIKDLVAEFTAGTMKLSCGKLTLALGNPAAIELGLRATEPHFDLNRSFVPGTIAHPGSYEHERASELAPFIAEAEVLVDLHATNKPSKPFVVATAVDATRMKLAARYACDAFVVAPDAVIAGTTDGWITAHGGYGIGYESGLAGDVTKVRDVRTSVLRTMADLGMIAFGRGPSYRQDVVRIEEAVLLSGRVFEFAAGKGLASFEPFAKGQTLGFIDGKAVTTPFDGLLMFPKPAHLRVHGFPVAFFSRMESGPGK